MIDKLFLFILLGMFLFSFVSAFGYNYLDEDIDGNITINQNITNIQSNASFNQTLTDSLYIAQSEEGNLNVNSSDLWDNLDDTNSTQFENNAGTLSIVLSWFSSQFDSLFSAKNTDDLSEGSSNLYDNQSWNETRGNDLYVNVDGDTMTGPLNMSDNAILLDGITLTPLDSNAQISGSVFGLNMTGPSGEFMPHFWVQSGGGGQASGISRSFMIVNENETQQGNAMNRTSCQAYMDYAGETLKIDCNTTTTGADLLVGDDSQFVGDVWIKDRQDEWHFMTRELSITDSMRQGATQGNIMFDHNDTEFIVYNAQDTLFVVNIQGVNYDVNNNATVALTSGTDATPVRNYLTFQVSGPNAVLTNDASYPSVSHSDTAVIIKGASDNVYLHLEAATLTKNFIYEVYDRAQNNFEQYISGFSASASASTINFTAGEYWTSLTEFDSTNTLDMLIDGFYIVHNNGTFEQCVDLSCLDEYNDGVAIPANAEFNVVWAVVPDSCNSSRLIAIPQNEPAVTYVTATAAEADEYNTITFTLDDTEINKHKLVLARTIVSNSADDFEAFANGEYYQSLIGIPSAGASAGGTNDHSLLDNLNWASAGHTFDTNLVVGAYNVTADWFKGKVNISDIQNFLFNYNQTVPAQTHADTNIVSNISSVRIDIVGNATEARTFTINTNNSLATFISNTYAALAGGNTITGNQDFNGGWTSGGASIVNGDIFAQTGYFYNITGLDVNTLRINGSILPMVGFDNQFDIGRGDLRWRDLYLGGEVYSNGTGDNYFAGNVGIGTSSPTANESNKVLHISDATSPGIRLTDSNAVNSDFLMYSPDGINSLYFYQLNTNTNMLTLNSATLYTPLNVGIGTTSPDSSLHVAKTSLPTITIEDSGAFTLFDAEGKISFQRASNLEFGNLRIDSGDVIMKLATSFSTGELAFHTNSDIERMRIDSDGNVGIGTTSPNQKLTVVGNIRLDGTTQPQILFNESNDGEQWSVNLYENNLNFDYPVAGSGNRKLTFDGPTGNVGIGTNSPDQTLTIDGDLRMYDTGKNSYFLFDNAGGTNDNMFIFRNSSQTNTWYLGQREDNGIFEILGYKGTSTALAIDTNLNVGIGTISPQNKLNVIGDINATGTIYADGQTDLTPDYVFDEYYDGENENNYSLMTLDEVREFTLNQKHLPGIPGVDEIGQIDLVSFQYKILEKVEELFLYVFEHEDRIDELEVENDLLKNESNAMKQTLCDMGREEWC